MKYDTPASFWADFNRLKPEHQEIFKECVKRSFIPACAAYESDPTTAWPRQLRVKPVVRAPGIFEMTWSFAGPDGRATFRFVTIDGQLHCQWRRIGGHGIFHNP